MGAKSLLRNPALPRVCLAAGWLAAGWLAAGCDSGSFPVGPSGATLSVRAVPSAITANGTSTIEILAKDASGLPIRVGTEVRVTTTLGRIVDQVITTDADGLAFTTLEADGRLGTATVTARSGGATEGAATVTIGAATLKADFECAGNDGELTVIFSYKQTSGAPSPDAFSWDFGDGAGSSAKDPVHTYAAAGSYLVTLTVSNQGGEDSASNFVTVPGGSCS